MKQQEISGKLCGGDMPLRLCAWITTKCDTHLLFTMPRDWLAACGTGAIYSRQIRTQHSPSPDYTATPEA
jgi:hypothetical protein